MSSTMPTKALANLGFDPYFEEKGFNPIIENALDTTTKNTKLLQCQRRWLRDRIERGTDQDEDFIFDEAK